jgi:hypothetical protein
MTRKSKAAADTYTAALSMLNGSDDTPVLAVAAIVAPPPLSEDEQRDVDFVKITSGALPGDLQVLALEFDLLVGRDRAAEDISGRDRQLFRLGALGFDNFLGHVQALDPEETTIFGKKNCYRWRIDLIVSRDVLDRRLRGSDGTHSLNIFFKWETPDGASFRVSFARAKLLKNLAHVYSHDTDEDSFLYMKGTAPEDHRQERRNAAVDQGHLSGNRFELADFARWAHAVQTTDKDLDRLFALVDACDGDLNVIRATLERSHEEPEPVSFLVPGLIPRGVVTLLLGDKKTGKSAVAMELAVAIARKESHWLGFPLAPCKGHAVYLMGEDSPGEAARRVQSMTGGETPDLLYVIPADGTELDGLLETLKKHKVDCLIVDPARKYHTGNEDDSTEISNMLNKLQTFAAAKNCAVVVLHHLKRGAVIRSIDDLGTSYRGSGVYTDRARVTLGLRRAGNETEIGIPAPGGTPLHNLMASEMFSGKRRLRRDEATFRHVPIGMTSTATTGGNTASGKKDVPAETAASVERVAVELLQSGERVTKTGKAAIFERKIPTLSSLTRAATRDAVDALVADGRLCCDTAGALSLPVSASGATLEGMI